MESSESKSIKRFYDGAEIFITGGSGFIGKVLIEKLLRSCDGVKAIYLLMRPNKGENPAQRLRKLTDNLLFAKLNKSQPNITDKLHVIEGDVMKLKLGISDSDREKIKSCSVIFHAAASVRFDDPLKSAILLNTRGTRELCELAKAMPNLKALVHVSTAYVQPKNLCVEERIFESDDDWKTFIKYAEVLDDDLINCTTLKLTNFAPNTYTFTKHLSEHVCSDYHREFNLPIAIVRPSIVTSCESEPVPGWCDNLNGPMGLVMVGALGINHVMNFNGANQMNMIPVDMCVKGLIIASHKVYSDRLQKQEREVPVYNAASIKFVSYSSMIECSEVANENPSMKAMGIPYVTFSTCNYYCWILRIFRNIIPALILDGLLRIGGGKPKVLKVHRIILTAEMALKFFASRVFKIDNFSFNDLSLLVPEDEKNDFALSTEPNGNIHLYHKTYLLMLEATFKESPADMPKARRRYRKVVLIVKTVHLMAFYIAFRLLNKLVLSL